MKRYAIVIPFVLLWANICTLHIVPAEDAYITFRYAENIAAGNGAVYNAGEYVYGSTELLFAAVLGAGGYIGLSIPALATTLGLLALIISVAIIAQRGWIVQACILAASPVAIHAASGFGMPVAGLFLLLAFTHMRTRWGYMWLALTAMIRPEAAVLFAWFVYRNRDDAASFKALWFAIPYLAFYVWVWSYYGSPVPNTFAAKLHMSEPAQGIKATTLFAAFCVLLVAGWRRLPQDAAVLILFGLSYLFISQYQNIGYRYQFWTLPALLSISPFSSRRLHDLAVGVLCVGFYVIVAYRGSDTAFDERVTIGRALATVQGQSMVTTEAGWLPYYSGWESHDAFGLYDRRIAQSGLDSAYLAELDPDLIVLRSGWKIDGKSIDLIGQDSTWHAMCGILVDYATSAQYGAITYRRSQDILVMYCRTEELRRLITDAIGVYDEQRRSGT